MPMLKPIFLGLLLVGPLAAEPHPFEWMAGSYADADTRESWTTAPNRQAFGLSQLRSDGKAYLSERLHIYPEGEGYRLDLEMHFFDGRTQKLTLKGKAEGERGVRFIGPKESLYYFKDERGHLRVELTKKTKLEFDLAPLAP